MSDRLAELQEQFDRVDQEQKREIGEYLYNRPAKWVPRQAIVDQFEIDESGVSRHISELHDEGYLASKYESEQRFVQWNGRGSGGIEYWIRQAIPQQLLAAGSELRPLLTIESLGGAYVPTVLFGVLILLGFATAIFAVVVAHHPSDAIFGLTIVDAVVWTGFLTIMASIALLLIPIIKLAEMASEKVLSEVIEFIKKGDNRR